MSAISRNSDPVWNAALQWLLQIKAAPHDSALQSEFAAWLAADEAHAEAYRRAEKVWRLTGHVAPAAATIAADHAAGHASPADRSQVQSAADRRRGYARPRAQWQVVAASLLAACLALFFIIPNAERLQPNHSTGVGEVQAVALADGSTVTLNADSAVTTELTAEQRQVSLLAGDAYFEVTSDGALPFTVNADDVAITVTGTAFEVRRNAMSVTVSVREGSVEVAINSADGAIERNSRTLRPGDFLTYASSDGRLLQGTVAPSQIAAWRNGRLIVERLAVADAIDRIRPFHRGAILVLDGALRERKVSGVYNLRNPEAALRAVVQPHGGSVRAVSPNLLVVSRL